MVQPILGNQCVRLDMLASTTVALDMGESERRAGYACFDSLCADHVLRCFCDGTLTCACTGSCAKCATSFSCSEWSLIAENIGADSPLVSEWYHVAERWRWLQGTVMSASGITSLIDGAGLVICIHGTRAVAARLNRRCSLHAARVSMHFERSAGVMTT